MTLGWREADWLRPRTSVAQLHCEPRSPRSRSREVFWYGGVRVPYPFISWSYIMSYIFIYINIYICMCISLLREWKLERSMKTCEKRSQQFKAPIRLPKDEHSKFLGHYVNHHPPCGPTTTQGLRNTSQNSWGVRWSWWCWPEDSPSVFRPRDERHVPTENGSFHRMWSGYCSWWCQDQSATSTTLQRNLGVCFSKCFFDPKKCWSFWTHDPWICFLALLCR